jgi:hypothetical protein
MAENIHGGIQFINANIHHLAHDGSKKVCNGAGMGSAAFISRCYAMRSCIELRSQRAAGAQHSAAPGMNKIGKILLNA